MNAIKMQMFGNVRIAFYPVFLRRTITDRQSGSLHFLKIIPGVGGHKALPKTSQHSNGRKSGCCCSAPGFYTIVMNNNSKKSSLTKKNDSRTSRAVFGYPHPAGKIVQLIEKVKETHPDLAESFEWSMAVLFLKRKRLVPKEHDFGELRALNMAFQMRPESYTDLSPLERQFRDRIQDKSKAERIFWRMKSITGGTDEFRERIELMVDAGLSKRALENLCYLKDDTLPELVMQDLLWMFITLAESEDHDFPDEKQLGNFLRVFQLLGSLVY